MASRNDSSWKTKLRATLRGVITPLAGNGRVLLGIGMLAILLVAGGYLGWARWGQAISTDERFKLTLDCFEITPQPAWIQSDVKAEVVRDARLTELSALDPELTTTVVQAFELNTWVAKVLWAGKRPGKTGVRVIVELQYREPVVMVRTHHQRWSGDCFWPVDTEGIFLPPDEFSASQTRNYMRVDAGDVPPMGAVGTSYGDPGVVGAAKIAANLGPNWQAMGLEWIVIRKDMLAEVGQPLGATYVLLTTGGDPDVVTQRPRPTRADEAAGAEIVWGHAPGLERQGEATAVQKAMRLQLFVKQNGPLDRLPGSTVLDLRPTASISVINRRGTFQNVSTQ